MRRILAIGAIVPLLAALASGGYWLYHWSIGACEPIRVGLLHSQTGPMRISEKSMIDGEILAIEEINARGGLLKGRRIEYFIADGQSLWPVYREKARWLLDEKHVDVIFGCWTSASRKMVKDVVEEKKSVLFYPMAYEGLELSPNIVYTGAAPNQQIIPAVKWCYDNLKARRFYLVGSDYIWPHAVNWIIRDQISALPDAQTAGELYITFGSDKVTHIIEDIKKTKPDVILSAVVGSSNIPFYTALGEAGIRSQQTPVVSFSIAEEELRELFKVIPREMVGNYSAWNYFQTIRRKENEQFIRAFREYYKEPDRVVSDVIVASYNSVKLWAQAVEEGGSSRSDTVLEKIKRQSLNAPEGVVSIDPATLHTWRPVYIAQVDSNGGFAIQWTSDKPIRPVPYPITRSREVWDRELARLKAGWNGDWQNPRPAEAGKSALLNRQLEPLAHLISRP